MLLGFKRRFAPFVEEGSKAHTIRAIRKIPPRVGEMCHCYVDPRQKTMRLLGRWPCVGVEEISIIGDGTPFRTRVVIGGARLSFGERNALAWADGFRNNGERFAFEEMLQFWLKDRGRRVKRLNFSGQIIYWKWSPPANARRLTR